MYTQGTGFKSRDEEIESVVDSLQLETTRMLMHAANKRDINWEQDRLQSRLLIANAALVRETRNHLIGIDRQDHLPRSDVLQKVCRLLILYALHSNTAAIPSQFFSPHMDDYPWWRSAFEYYSHSATPDNVYLAALIYHEYIRDGNVNSGTLRDRVEHLSKAIGNNIQRILQLMEKLFALGEHELMANMYTLLTKGDTQPSVFEDALKRIELALLAPDQPGRSGFNTLVRDGYPPSLAAVGAYERDNNVPAEVASIVEQELPWEQVGHLLKGVKDVLSKVYCCNTNVLVAGKTRRPGFYDIGWEYQAQVVADEVPRALAGLDVIEAAYDGTRYKEAFHFIRLLLNSVSGFIVAMGASCGATYGLNGMELGQYTNKQFRTVSTGIKALEIINDLLPADLADKSKEEIVAACFAMQAVISCANSFSRVEDCSDAANLTAARDFRRLVVNSTNPRQVLTHYFDRRSADQPHASAVAEIDDKYPEYADDFETVMAYVNHLTQQKENIVTGTMLAGYHSFREACTYLLEHPWKIEDQTVVTLLNRVGRLPCRIGEVDEEAFPESIQPDLIALLKYQPSEGICLEEKDIDAYVEVVPLLANVESMAATPLLLQCVVEIKARVAKRFGAFPPFPIENLATIKAAVQFLSASGGPVSEKFIRDYASISALVEEVAAVPRHSVYLRKLIADVQKKVATIFNCEGKDLFPLDKVEEVIVLFHYANSCEQMRPGESEFALPPTDFSDLEAKQGQYPFVASCFRKIYAREVFARHAVSWRLVLGGGENLNVAQRRGLTKATVSEGEKIMLGIASGHMDRAAEEWLMLERSKSIGLLPFGAKIHTKFPLYVQFLEALRKRLGFSQTSFKLAHRDSSLIFPPGSVADFQLRAFTLMGLGVLDNNDGDMQFTCAGRLLTDPTQLDAAYLATMMLMTTEMQVIYSAESFRTSHDSETGRRILLTDPMISGERIAGLPFDLPKANGRLDMLGMRDIKVSPHDWQLWNTLVKHEVFQGDDRFRRLYEYAKAEFASLIDAARLSKLIRRTSWVHRPEMELVEDDIQAHAEMVAAVCEVRANAMTKQGQGIVGDSRKLMAELRSGVAELQPILAKEKPDDTARLLAGR